MPNSALAAMCESDDVEDLGEVKVAIVGNGPSAITLSYMLSGWTPYPAVSQLLDDDLVRLRLAYQGESIPITEMNLMELSEGLEGRTTNPIALFFDHLCHPYADLGLRLPSQIKWVREPAKAVNHLVFGTGYPGGLWQDVQPEMKTLSKVGWMELPNMSIEKWLKERDERKSKSQRAYAGDLYKYYHDYVITQNLEDKFINHSFITDIHEIENTSGDSESHWLLCGKRQINGTQSSFKLRSKYVVLATGSNSIPKTIDILGENLPYVHHNVHLWDQLLDPISKQANPDPILVVGAGLSAADAILAARNRGLAIIHVFRETPCGSASAMLKKLPQGVYPEYAHMYKLMCGDEVRHWYKPLAHYTIKSFSIDARVGVISPDLIEESYDISAAIIQIGSRPSLSYLENGGQDLGVTPGLPIDSKHNPIDVDPFSYRSSKMSRLYALGPLVGDNFVRFLKGGALAITL